MLDRLVSSLQCQSYSNWRLLFVDGPSDELHRNWLNQCCSSDSRCSWVEQSLDQPGIFGAMNIGFSMARPDDWILFWGSDDWAPGPDILQHLTSAIESSDSYADLIVCKARYVDQFSLALGRISSFQSDCLLNSSQYRRSLFLGSTPPHQATLFGPVRSKLAYYSAGFRLSADLDYFLKLSRHHDLLVQCLDLELVHMADGGVSGQQHQRRFYEVLRAYRNAFSWLWWFPFLTRYLRRLVSLLFSPR